MTLFLTADHHFGHARILDYTRRPYRNVDEMNEALIALWNNTVTPADTVWVLGDFALGRRQDTLPLVRRLNGTVKLLPGNHDACWSGHNSAAGAVSTYLEAGFDAILGEPVYLRLADRTVRFSHFPYPGTDPHERQRYTAWLPKDYGSWLVHGHVHDHWRTRGRMVNVGVDAWAGRPVPVDVIEQYVTADEPANEAPLPWRP